MKKIYLLLSVVIIGLLVVFYASKEEYTTPITYDETKTPFQNKLMKFDYESNNEIKDKITMYVIKGSEENLQFNKDHISRDGNIILNIKKDEDFIISLPANKTVAAKWIFNADNSTSNNLILEKEEWLDTFKPIPKNNDGVSYARQFFYFKPLNAKNLLLKFEYAPAEKQNDGSENNHFQFNLSVTIS